MTTYVMVECTLAFNDKDKGSRFWLSEEEADSLHEYVVVVPEVHSVDYAEPEIVELPELDVEGHGELGEPEVTFASAEE
jgi:hypothetical protein